MKDKKRKYAWFRGAIIVIKKRLNDITWDSIRQTWRLLDNKKPYGIGLLYAIQDTIDLINKFLGYDTYR